MLIFIPAQSHATGHLTRACWRLCWEDARDINHPQKSNGWFCSYQKWPFVHSTVTVCLIHMKDWQRNTLAWAQHSLWTVVIKFAGKDPNVWTGIQWFDGR